MGFSDKSRSGFNNKPVNIDCTIRNIIPGQSYCNEMPLSLKFDTGADFTVIRADSLGITCSEEKFTSWLQESENITVLRCGHPVRNSILVAKSLGIDKGTVGDERVPIKSYGFQVDRFIIDGDVNMRCNIGSVPLFVTFDKRVEADYLGVDILSLFDIEINFSKQYLQFNKRVLNTHNVTHQYMLQNGIYELDKGLYLLSRDILDELQSKASRYGNLSSIDMFVLDECTRLFNKPYWKQLHEELIQKGYIEYY